MGIRCGEKAGTKRDGCRPPHSLQGGRQGIYTMKALGGGNLTADYQNPRLCLARNLWTRSWSVLRTLSEIDDMMCYLSGTMESLRITRTFPVKDVRQPRGPRGCGACLKICAAGAVHYNKNGLAEIDQSKCLTCGYCARAAPVRAIIMY